MAKKSRKPQPVEQRKMPRSSAWLGKLDTDLLAISAIAAIWLIAAILINPLGNFPLNDDWCYGKAVQNLLRDHDIRFVGITTMTLIAQVLWGALFCIFGFSFTALRISTLVLGLAGLIATYGLMREARAPRWAALFGCTLVALNPLYLPLSYGFMTDVPFTAVALITAYVYLQSLKRDSVKLIVLGTALALAATLIRQFGVILPIGFALAYIVRYGIRPRNLVTALVPVAAVVLVLVGYVYWLKASGRMPYLFNTQASALQQFAGGGPSKWFSALLGVARTIYVYVGLFLLPFTLLAFRKTWQAITVRQRTWNTVCAVVSAIIVSWSTIGLKKLMPLNHAAGDYIYNFGIGPPTLRDPYVDLVNNLPGAPQGFWLGVTVAGIIGGALLLWHLLAAVEAVFVRDRDRVSAQDRAFMVMLLTVTVLYLSPMVPLTAFVYFDRYLLCAVPLLTVIVMLAAGSLAKPTPYIVAAGLLVLLVIGVFSVCCTHDYMSWNRVRWQALDELAKKDGVLPEEVDGGYEFNGWHNYRENDREQKWWRSVYDDYAITFGPINGFEELRSYRYSRWLPPVRAHIYVLQRTWY